MSSQPMTLRTARAPLRRPAVVNRASAGAFVVGGSLFAVGAALAQGGTTSTRTVGLTYLVGGVFFSLGGWLLVRLADLTTGADVRRGALRDRALAWRSAAVLFAGTLLFAVSLVAALAQGLTPRQLNRWVWLPDLLGCACFLLSGRLALVGLRRRPATTPPTRLDWSVAIVNQVGSVLFLLAGIASFTRPVTSQALNEGLVDWGTFAGAVCFAIGGGLQAFDPPDPTTTRGPRPP